jgi:hypothetical protein
MQFNLKNKLPKESGFALLMTLIVVGVVITIGISMLDLSTRQVRLSSNVKESEIAFSAANAGNECSRFTRLSKTVQMESGYPITPNCFGGVLVSNTNSAAPSFSGGGSAELYSYSFTWGGAGNNERCTKIDTLVVVSDPQAAVATKVTNMDDMFPGYPAELSGVLDCDIGSQCTIVSSRGYNKPCGSISNYGVVEREVLIQY